MFRIKNEKINPSRFGFRQIGFRRIVFYLHIFAPSPAPFTLILILLSPFVFGFTGIIYLLCWDFVKQFHSDNNNNNNNSHECVQQSTENRKKNYTRFTCYPIISIDLFTWFKHDFHFASVASSSYTFVARISAWISKRAQFHFGYSMLAIFCFLSGLTCLPTCASFTVDCRMHCDIVWWKKNIDFFSTGP